MFKVVKLIVLLLGVSLGVFILWMNLTPGHFQLEDCGCGVVYGTDEIRPDILLSCTAKKGCNYEFSDYNLIDWVDEILVDSSVFLDRNK